MQVTTKSAIDSTSRRSNFFVTLCGPHCPYIRHYPSPMSSGKPLYPVALLQKHRPLWIFRMNGDRVSGCKDRNTPERRVAARAFSVPSSEWPTTCAAKLFLSAKRVARALKQANQATYCPFKQHCYDWSSSGPVKGLVADDMSTFAPESNVAHVSGATDDT